MAVVFTVQDIEAYKAALARHAAKNSCLIEKWTKTLELLKKDLEELHGCKPGIERDYRCRDKESSIFYVSSFLDDLRLPADSEISDFEWRGCE